MYLVHLNTKGVNDRMMKTKNDTAVVGTPIAAISAGNSTIVSGILSAKASDETAFSEQPEYESLLEPAEESGRSSSKVSDLQTTDVPPAPPTSIQQISSFQVPVAISLNSADVEVDLHSPPRAADARCLQHEDVMEVIAKEEAQSDLTEARTSKLTPEVPGRQVLITDDDEDSDDQVACFEDQEEDLVAAMIGLAVAPTPKAPIPLRGLPVPQGRHIRFDAKGKPLESPERTVLRGLPVATGKHTRFG
ncbi:hypothetical protein VaNZ11_009012 [Volvox africanus]|uniref:Uncharacterized protein n=1 Tax=Volvox africanus TaxID=51714 RepID=A0ABQ5S6R4_9CHLO|nr:hypothetical protein VaNZ11_009012 [Volvox africanus]